MNAQAHPYQELAAKIARAIDGGEVALGSRLPSVRALAKEHGVSAMTAQKALNQLVTEGYAEAIAGLGYFAKERAGEARAATDELKQSLADELGELRETVESLRLRVEALERRS